MFQGRGAGAGGLDYCNDGDKVCSSFIRLMKVCCYDLGRTVNIQMHATANHRYPPRQFHAMIVESRLFRSRKVGLNIRLK